MGPTTSNLTLQSSPGNTTVASSARPAPQPARPARTPAPVEQPKQDVSVAESAESVREAIAQMNDAMKRASVGVEFSLDQGSGRVIVRVVDSESKEILRQIPSEQMLAISRAIDDLRGVLIEQKA